MVSAREKVAAAAGRASCRRLGTRASASEQPSLAPVTRPSPSRLESHCPTQNLAVFPARQLSSARANQHAGSALRVCLFRFVQTVGLSFRLALISLSPRPFFPSRRPPSAGSHDVLFPPAHNHTPAPASAADQNRQLPPHESPARETAPEHQTSVTVDRQTASTTSSTDASATAQLLSTR
ncbi:hypothetical protein OH77DRAFT_643457 [Trametes cingulata]|nr:hypothetical protein OH77DRAFT_643457 [Trametes cingulata]